MSQREKFEQLNWEQYIHGDSVDLAWFCWQAGMEEGIKLMQEAAARADCNYCQADYALEGSNTLGWFHRDKDGNMVGCGGYKVRSLTPEEVPIHVSSKTAIKLDTGTSPSPAAPCEHCNGSGEIVILAGDACWTEKCSCGAPSPRTPELTEELVDVLDDYLAHCSCSEDEPCRVCKRAQAVLDRWASPHAEGQPLDERIEFEKWVYGSGLFGGFSLRRNPDNSTYYYYEVDNCWWAWQARAALGAPPEKGGHK